ncbi:MAG: ATP-dependent Clp protease ATP-binding subunit [Oscillospiraceae bacterium]|nr:ATP-dependent Clp protease ATP-binding subunit [Oscillospiraceae bacterium]
MKCNKCKKGTAVVFITTMQGNEKRNEGLCEVCAKKLGIPQVGDYTKQMGITEMKQTEFPENELKAAIEESCKAIFGDGGLFENIVAEHGEESEADDEQIDAFKMGGTDVLPDFLQNIFKDIFGEDTPVPTPIVVSSSTHPRGFPGLITASISRDKSPREAKKAKKAQIKENPKRKFLDAYCTNVTAKAQRGELDKVIGREKEIERVIQILSRRTKNNPCLIGEPGVGKTAIAEGIAQKLVAGEVPFRLQKKEIYLLDLTVLIAGTQFRGQFEQRVKSLLEEIKNDGNIIVFIDEVHGLVGTGDSDGTMNAANMFKPALSRGEMQVIGATTFKEYRKHIEKDGALERRFQPVTVAEPTLAETVELLKGIKKYYEEHHKIRVPDAILRSCATLSERYITDRFLPDKAIDLLDEAAACASIRNKDLGVYEKLKTENFKLAKRESELVTVARFPEDVDYAKIAELKTLIAQNNERLAELEPIVGNLEVTENDLSTVIELWTGVPAAKILEAEFRKIMNIESVLKSKVIGQDSACELVATAIRRSRVRLSARKRPASFIFVGPTGVGKTELVKILAGELFDSVDPLIRLDMSEFMEKHSVSRIIGSPPGYIGYDEAGQLTEKVRRKPYSVVLFDEIEKAHPDVMNILLQILDEGKVNDAHGRTVSFENTVIAMTSNAGSTDKSTGLGFAKTDGDVSQEKVMKALKEFLRPEFLSRVDEVVVFKPLTKEHYAGIARLMVEEMREPLGEKNIKLRIAEEVYEYIAGKAFGNKYGGRDIRRVIRDEVENAVATLIVRKSGEGKPIRSVGIAVKGEKISVR